MDEPTYTPTEDVYEVYKDGSGRALVAKAGVPMPWSRAHALGLVKVEAAPADFRITSDNRTLKVVSRKP